MSPKFHSFWPIMPVFGVWTGGLSSTGLEEQLEDSAVIDSPIIVSFSYLYIFATWKVYYNITRLELRARGAHNLKNIRVTVRRERTRAYTITRARA